MVDVVASDTGGTTPLDTTRFTAEPTVTLVHSQGDSLMIEPEATVLLEAVATVPTARPASVMEVVAAAWVRPTALGTAICARPLETTMFTAEPTLMLVPAAAGSPMTEPEATVLLNATVTVPTVSPTPVIEAVAADCVIPTTFGTATIAVLNALLLAVRVIGVRAISDVAFFAFSTSLYCAAGLTAETAPGYPLDKGHETRG
jgi:hypothetical protein